MNEEHPPVIQPQEQTWAEFFERFGHDESLTGFLCEEDRNQGVQTRDPFADSGEEAKQTTPEERAGTDLPGRLDRKQ